MDTTTLGGKRRDSVHELDEDEIDLVEFVREWVDREVKPVVRQCSQATIAGFASP